ncbi:MAG: alpha/beta hydrolase family protein [Planctomycetaceae bacterium]
MIRTLLICGFVGAVLIGSPGLEQAVAEEQVAYDPLQVLAVPDQEPLSLTVIDNVRNRELPIRVYLPRDRSAAPVALFSHGLGGSRENSPYLGKHWSGRGYVTVVVQHPGSDDSVWRDTPVLERMAEMRRAANAENTFLRFRDIPAVLDQLQVWNDSDAHPLRSRLNLEQIGMSGHSFGAVTTQAVSGQSLSAGRQPFTDRRIKAAIAMSPSSPMVQRVSAGEAFGDVTIPWLLMTGTRDTAPVGGQTVESRLAVYPALPPGRKYQLVLDKAEHSAFTDRPLPGDREARNPNHHRAILAISTAFWDACLRNNSAAQDWLDGDGPRSILEPQDRWQRK